MAEPPRAGEGVVSALEALEEALRAGEPAGPLLERAAELSRKIEPLDFVAHGELGRVFVFGERLDDAVVALDAAADAAQACHAFEHEAQALHLAVLILLERVQYLAAAIRLERLVELARLLDVPTLHRDAALLETNLALLREAPERALRLGREALRWTFRVGEPAAIAQALGLRAAALAGLGRHVEARRSLAKLRRYLPEADDVASSTVRSAGSALATGAHAEALAYAEQALATPGLSERARLEVRVDRGVILWQAGRGDEALADFAAVSASGEVGRETRALARLNTCSLKVSLDRPLEPEERAYLFSDEARAEAPGLAHLSLCRGAAHLAADEPELALGELDGHDVADLPGRLAVELQAHRAIAHWRCGRVPQALELLDGALARAAGDFERGRLAQVRGRVLAASYEDVGVLGAPRRVGEEALEALVAQERLHAAAGRAELVLDARRERARLLTRLGRLDEAFAAVLALADVGGGSEERAALLSSCADDAVCCGRPQDALDLADACLALCEGPGTTRDKARLRRGLALGSLGLAAQAQAQFEEAAAGAADVQARNQARIMSALGALGAAQPLSAPARDFLLSDEALREVLWPINTHLARVHYWLSVGSPESALPELQPLLEEARSREKRRPAFAAEVHWCHALALSALDRPEEALAALGAAESQAEVLAPFLRATLAYRSGWMAQSLGRFSEAAAAARRSVALLGALEPAEGPVRRFAQVLLVRARSSAGELEPAAAADELRGLLAAWEPQEDLASAEALMLLAALAREVAPGERAARLLEAASSGLEAVDAWTLVGALAEEQGDCAGALFAAGRACAVVRQQLGLLELDSARLAVQARARLAAQLFVHLALATDVMAALEAAIRAKSETLLQLMRVRAEQVPALREELAVLASGRAAAQRSALRPGAAAAASAEEVFALQAALVRTDARARHAWQELEVRPAELLALIPPEAAVLELYPLESDELVAFVLTGAGVTATRTPFSAESREALAALPELFGRHAPAGSAGARLRSACLRRLYRLLIEPSAPRLGGCSTLVVSPGAALAGVPFAALLDERGEALLSRCELAYLLSAGQLPFLRSPGPRRPGRLLALRGDDGAAGLEALAYADAELAHVCALAASRGLQVSRGDATWDRVRLDRELEAAEVLHYSGHARFDARAGMSAALFPVGGVPPGSALRASELLALDLSRVELCVLSACESGRSEAGGGELVGLLRALFGAGAAAALCSTWVVDDEATHHYMGAVYAQWLAGTPLRAAVCNVSRQLLRDGGPGGRWREPEHWANFCLYGGL